MRDQKKKKTQKKPQKIAANPNPYETIACNVLTGVQRNPEASQALHLTWFSCERLWYTVYYHTLLYYVIIMVSIVVCRGNYKSTQRLLCQARKMVRPSMIEIRDVDRLMILLTFANK